MQIIVYRGPGVSRESLKHTLGTLKALLPGNKIKEVSAQEIIHESWEKETAFIVIPGGADIPYCKELNGRGNQKIAAFVREGGSYLGICAGAYYAGNFVEFAKETDLEVTGARELSLFGGTVRGPILAPYDTSSKRGARAAKIQWRATPFIDKTQFTVYYNGGGYFVGVESCPETSVLATYDLGEDYPAMIECKVGLGNVILSGVHFEYDPFYLDQRDQYHPGLIQELELDNAHRLALARHLLERCLLKNV